MYFASKIQVESQIAAVFLLLSIVAAVTYGIGGGAFKWFTWEKKYILEVALVLIVVFIVTYSIIIWQNTELSKKINKVIKERDEKEK